jgi:hypothetical protein
VVAVVAQPLRNRLQRGVNRLTYGQRDEPYAVIAQLGRRLEASAHTDTVLAAAVETLARALRLPYAAIRLGSDGAPVAAYGTPAPEPLALPLRHGADRIGQLLVAPRRPGEAFTGADLRLLDDVARQVGSAARAVVLAADLQRSRERLVAAREEERRPGPERFHDQRADPRGSGRGGPDRRPALPRHPVRHRRHQAPGLRPAAAQPG